MAFSLVIAFVACIVAGVVLVVNGATLWAIWPVSLSVLFGLMIVGLTAPKKQEANQRQMLMESGKVKDPSRN